MTMDFATVASQKNAFTKQYCHHLLFVIHIYAMIKEETTFFTFFSWLCERQVPKQNRVKNQVLTRNSTVRKYTRKQQTSFYYYCYC
jgi:hypothetical protein